MPYYQITEKGSEKYEDFWQSPHIRRTWHFTKDDELESGILEDLWQAADPIWYAVVGAKGRILRKLEGSGLITVI